MDCDRRLADLARVEQPEVERVGQQRMVEMPGPSDHGVLMVTETWEHLVDETLEPRERTGA